MERVRTAKIGPWLGGIDEKTAKYGLPVGKIAGGQNVLLDEKPGHVVKRPGSLALSTLPSGDPARDGYEFKKSDGSSFLLASDGSNLYYTVDPSVQANWTLLKSGLNSDGFMEFETAHGQVWMSNGVDEVMSWDGTTLTIYDREKTVTIDNSAITSTTVQNTQLTEADDYWNGQTIVFTSGANMGITAVITDFVAATDTLTFSPALPNATAVGDRFKVGLIIPKGRGLRFWDGHLWSVSTDANESEARFDSLTDPNTGSSITPSHPLAWPGENQLEVYAEDGDRIWGVSPVLRDRILIAKATGLFRIERDPLTIYKVEVVTRAIGSRFPRSWAIKNELLYFVGQDKDGYPEVYKTDMVDVAPVDPNGGIEPTVRNLAQPNSVQKSIGDATKADFDAGTKSTLVDTSSGSLAVGGAIPALLSQSNLNTKMPDGSSGYRGLLGIPTWDVRYECDVIPSADANPWTQQIGGSITAAGGEITYHAAASSNTAVWRRQNVLSATKNAILTVRMKTAASDGSNICVGLFNGSYAVYLWIEYVSGLGHIRAVNTGNSGYTQNIGFNPSTYSTYTLQLLAGGTYKIWRNGVLWLSGSAIATTRNEVLVGASAAFGGASGDPTWADGGSGGSVYDYHYYSADSDAAPDALLTAGNFVVQYDYTRSPDALGRFFAAMTAYGATVGLESWSSDTSDFSSGTDPAGYLSFTNGNQPTSAAKRYLRIRVTITAPDYANSPDITGIFGGTLWLSQAHFIGAAISGWRSFIAGLTAPAGTDQVVKIRRATVSVSPSEGDWDSWCVITNGDNIGTVLSDSTPPGTRWVQIKVEQGPASDGTIPKVASLRVQWNEGSTKILPLLGVVHKKRYLFCAAQGGSVDNDIVIVSDRNDAWMKWLGLNLNAIIHFKGQLVGFSSTDETILGLESGLDDQGAAIDAFIETREETLDHEELRKDLKYSYVHIGDAAGDLEVSIKRPVDTTWAQAKTLTCDGRGNDIRTNYSLGTSAKRFQRRYRNNVAGQDLALRGETFYFTTRGPQP